MSNSNGYTGLAPRTVSTRRIVPGTEPRLLLLVSWRVNHQDAVRGGFQGDFQFEPARSRGNVLRYVPCRHMLATIRSIVIYLQKALSSLQR
jgi:hypothetical protein